MFFLFYLLAPILSAHAHVRVSQLSGSEILLQLDHAYTENDLKLAVANELNLRPSDFELHPAPHAGTEDAYTLVKLNKVQIRRIFEENENDEPITVLEATTLYQALAVLCPEDIDAMVDFSSGLRRLWDLPLAEIKQLDPATMHFKKVVGWEPDSFIQVKHPDDDWITEKPKGVRKISLRQKAEAFREELSRVKNSSTTFKIYRVFYDNNPGIPADNPLVLPGETTLRDALQQLDRARFEQTVELTGDGDSKLRDSLDYSLAELVRNVPGDRAWDTGFCAEFDPPKYGILRIYPDGMHNAFADEHWK